jgi:3-hydroxymyristoyl/3-hydroxydecanoyl-(acyl carrier protein) dehydratase
VLTANLDRVIRGLWKFSAVAYVGDKEVSSAEIMVAPGEQANKGG